MRIQATLIGATVIAAALIGSAAGAAMVAGHAPAPQSPIVATVDTVSTGADTAIVDTPAVAPVEDTAPLTPKTVTVVKVVPAAEPAGSADLSDPTEDATEAADRAEGAAKRAESAADRAEDVVDEPAVVVNPAPAPVVVPAPVKVHNPAADAEQRDNDQRNNAPVAGVDHLEGNTGPDNNTSPYVGTTARK